MSKTPGYRYLHTISVCILYAVTPATRAQNSMGVCGNYMDIFYVMQEISNMAAGLNLQPQTVNGLLTLDLSNQGLTSIPEEVFDITDLEVLDVSKNILTSIPDAIGRLQKLNRLSAYSNMLTSLPQAIGSLQKLTHLYVYHNKLANLPPGIEKLQKLTKLSIFYNQLTALPPGVCSLPNLEVLIVSNNKISTFPPGVEKLQKLRELGIGDNQLTEVPSGVCSLPNLEVLSVSNNKISTFPPGVEKLQKLRVLGIHGNQLTEVPSGVCSLPNIERLSVGGNPIRRLPDDVTRLARLKSLSVPNCQFDEFPRQVLQLKTLEKLYAGGCKFDMVPDEVGNLHYLWFLALDNNLLRTLPSTMSHLHSLRDVRLRNNKFDTFPDVLCKLHAMEILHIRNNNFTRLPTTLHRADKLKDLDISGNPLTYPPQDVCEQGTGATMAFLKQEAENLQPQTVNGRLKLDLSSQGLTSIPEEVFDITDLKVLDVSNNELTSIPEAIGRLQKLSSLHAEGNMLTSLPEAIGSLQELTHLFINDNKLSTFRPGVEKLQKLAHLFINDNQLREVPPGVCSLPNLEVLCIRNNKVSTFPPGVEKLQKLRELYVHDNQLTEVPPGVCSLSNLEVFIVINNKLSTLPPGMSQLHNLREILLGNNKFDTFPEVLCKLPAMKKLDIRNNNITRLPTALHRADKLKDLDVSGNPLTYPPQDVCEQGTGAIMAFLKQEAEKEGTKKARQEEKGSAAGKATEDAKVPHEGDMMATAAETELERKLRGRWEKSARMQQQVSQQKDQTVERIDISKGAAPVQPQPTERDETQMRTSEAQKRPVPVTLKLTGDDTAQETEVEKKGSTAGKETDEVLDAQVTTVGKGPHEGDTMATVAKTELERTLRERREKSARMQKQVSQQKDQAVEKMDTSTGASPVRPSAAGRVSGAGVAQKQPATVTMTEDNTAQKMVKQTGQEQKVLAPSKGTKEARAIQTTLVKAARQADIMETAAETELERKLRESAQMQEQVGQEMDQTVERMDTSIVPEGAKGQVPEAGVAQKQPATLKMAGDNTEQDKDLGLAFSRLALKVKQSVEWKHIARQLGFNNQEVKDVESESPDDPMYETLVRWRERAGPAASLAVLERCLRDLDLHQLADQISRTAVSPARRGHEPEESGASGGQLPGDVQSRYPSVTIDRRFPIVESGRLEEQSILGRGGFAYVMKARHRDWRQVVAVKCLLTRKIEGSEQELLYSEARKLNQGSRSDHVISLLGVCLDPNFAIVMPYMENGSLAGLLQDVDVPWALRWRMAHEISLGMTFLHCQNPQILHCDLKAENVLLDGDFRVKISDFGLSKWRTKSRVVTTTSPVGGTITHLPPEYFLDINALPTTEFDVYSFGVLLWEIITRTDPYGNAIANSAHIRLAVTSGQRPDMTLVPTDPPDVATVSQLMQTCWSQNPEDRPTFNDCADRLHHVKNRFTLEEILQAISTVVKNKAAASKK
ncbi:uncharacterized protein LOC144866057 [Branchiostoma floridae x Branchiostoma japonicum]